MTNNSRRKQVLTGTFVLTASAFIAKLLSAVYRVPFQNMVGNVGFYVYQQIYPIYGIGMTFALNGLPMFISKLVVDVRDPADQIALIRRLQVFLSIISLIIFLGLQFGAQTIALAMTDGHLAPVIRAVSWMFLFTPFLATWRGYFQGRLEMGPTAYSQVIEQVVRVTVILVIAGWAIHAGADPYMIGELAMFSAPVAGACALLVLLFTVRRKQLPRPSKRANLTPLFRRLIFEGGTLCLVSAVMLLLQLVDSFSVVAGLRHFGLSFAAAQNLKGIYDRSQTLVQLGMVVTMASTTAALPSLSLAHGRGQQTTFDHLAATEMRVNFALALAMSAGLFVLMPQINTLLFSSADLSLTIGVYCVSIVLVTIILTASTILQAVGRYRATMAAIISGVIVKILINHWLVARFSAMGASAATLIGLLVMMIVLRVLAARQLAHLFNGLQVLKLLVVLAAMSVLVKLITSGIAVGFQIPLTRMSAMIEVVIGIPVGVGIFLLGCRVLNVFLLREWFAIPMIGRLMRLLKI